MNVAASARHARHNVPPRPHYFNVCATQGWNDPACIKRALAAINHARSREHMTKRRMILPRDYRKLTVSEQTFVITNLERVDRGLRPFQGMTKQLDQVAQIAAVAHLDPSLGMAVLRALHIDAFGSNWAGDLGPLSSDYDWMYHDGYSAGGSINLACLTPSSPGCWGHRNNILSTYGNLPLLVAGMGTGKPAGASIAEIMTAGRGRKPTFVYTWKQALRHGANGHRVRNRP